MPRHIFDLQDRFQKQERGLAWSCMVEAWGGGLRHGMADLIPLRWCMCYSYVLNDSGDLHIEIDILLFENFP